MEKIARTAEERLGKGTSGQGGEYQAGEEISITNRKLPAEIGRGKERPYLALGGETASAERNKE